MVLSTLWLVSMLSRHPWHRYLGHSCFQESQLRTWFSHSLPPLLVCQSTQRSKCNSSLIFNTHEPLLTCHVQWYKDSSCSQTSDLDSIPSFHQEHALQPRFLVLQLDQFSTRSWWIRLFATSAIFSSILRERTYGLARTSSRSILKLLRGEVSEISYLVPAEHITWSRLAWLLDLLLLFHSGSRIGTFPNFSWIASKPQLLLSGWVGSAPELTPLSYHIWYSVSSVRLICEESRPVFFAKWNMIVTAAIGGGVQIIVFILTFTVFGGGGKAHPFPEWWGNNFSGNVDRCEYTKR